MRQIDLSLKNNFRIRELHRPKPLELRVTTALLFISDALGLGLQNIAFAGITWAQLISTAVTIGFTAASIIYSALAGSSGGQVAGHEGQEKTTSQLENGQLINTRQSSQPLRVVYGIMKVGGNWVFSRTSPGNVNILNNIVTWAEGEVTGLAPAIDFSPLFSGSGINDLHTGGDFAYMGCTCDMLCYSYSPCSCNFATY